MIRIRKKTAPIPSVLLMKGKAARASLEQCYDAGNRDFTSKDFDNNIYGHQEVKASLIAAQDYKCCFCESKIGHIAYVDVEHYRPKAGWVQDEEPINKPGYYWLAYEWDNLLLSCEKCNQRYKKNYFPLANNTRAFSHHDNVDLEEPLFVHPGKENAEAFITFNEEVPVAINDNLRGAATIKRLGLDRELLNERRREKLNTIRVIYKLAKGYPDTYPELKEEAKQEIYKIYEESQLDSTEYASMLRAFFKKHPIDF